MAKETKIRIYKLSEQLHHYVLRIVFHMQFQPIKQPLLKLCVCLRFHALILIKSTQL